MFHCSVKARLQLIISNYERNLHVKNYNAAILMKISGFIVLFEKQKFSIINISKRFISLGYK